MEILFFILIVALLMWIYEEGTTPAGTDVIQDHDWSHLNESAKKERKMEIKALVNEHENLLKKKCWEHCKQCNGELLKYIEENGFPGGQAKHYQFHWEDYSYCCDRCGKGRKLVRSVFVSYHTICCDCHRAEHSHPDYVRALRALEEAVRQENDDFWGIGLPADMQRTD